MSHESIPEFVSRFFPGAFGALLSLLWIAETPLRKLVFFMGGTIFATFGSPQIAPYTHLGDGFLLGTLLGLGSMSFFAKCFETWNNLQLTAFVRAFVAKWSGVTVPPDSSASKKHGDF